MILNKNSDFSIFYMLTASFFFAVGTIISKIVGKSEFAQALHPLQIAHSRFFFALLLILVIVYIRRKPIISENLKIHILRSVCGWAGVSILFTGVLYIPVSDATAITFLNPICAMVFAVFLLGERIGLYRWVAVSVTFFGAILLIRPSSSFDINPIALLCLLGAIIMGLESICIKILSVREPPLQILFINNLTATIIASLPVIFVFKLPTLDQSLFLMGVGTCFVIGQLFFLKAVKGSEVSFIAPFFYSTLIFVIILDFSIFSIIPDYISFLGSLIIVTGGSFIAYREYSKSISAKKTD